MEEFFSSFYVRHLDQVSAYTSIQQKSEAVLKSGSIKESLQDFSACGCGSHCRHVSYRESQSNESANRKNHDVSWWPSHIILRVTWKVNTAPPDKVSVSILSPLSFLLCYEAELCLLQSNSHFTGPLILFYFYLLSSSAPADISSIFLVPSILCYYIILINIYLKWGSTRRHSVSSCCVYLLCQPLF